MRKVRKTQPLVVGYLERVSSKVFLDYSKQITELVGRKHGVYALYKGKRLYYVGLATNLRNRIKQHLRDKHSGKWDKFSLYLVRQAEQIREIESLILRIADPTGNATKGKLPRAENLRNVLLSDIKKEQEKHIARLFGLKHSIKKERRKKVVKKRKAPFKPALAPYVKERFPIRATNKGKTYKARVRKDGKIYYDGEIYYSPSLAGKAALGRAVSGWYFWKYKNKKGEWVKLTELRK